MKDDVMKEQMVKQLTALTQKDIMKAMTRSFK